MLEKLRSGFDVVYGKRLKREKITLINKLTPMIYITILFRSLRIAKSYLLEILDTVTQMHRKTMYGFKYFIK